MNINYEKIVGWLAGLVVIGILVWGYTTSMQNKTPDVPVGQNPQQGISPTMPSISEYLKTDMLTNTETADWGLFSSEEFAIKYPKDFTLNKNYTNQTLGPGKERNGISFTIPASMTTGTNLSKDSFVSVETLPHASTCEAKEFFDGIAQTSVSFDGGTLTFVQTSDAGAGNFYEEYLAAVPSKNGCQGIRLLIHSTNIGNYDPGTIKEFDRTQLLSIYETIIREYSYSPATN